MQFSEEELDLQEAEGKAEKRRLQRYVAKRGHEYIDTAGRDGEYTFDIEDAFILTQEQKDQDHFGLASDEEYVRVEITEIAND